MLSGFVLCFWLQQQRLSARQTKGRAQEKSSICLLNIALHSGCCYKCAKHTCSAIEHQSRKELWGFFFNSGSPGVGLHRSFTVHIWLLLTYQDNLLMSWVHRFFSYAFALYHWHHPKLNKTHGTYLLKAECLCPAFQIHMLKPIPLVSGVQVGGLWERLGHEDLTLMSEINTIKRETQRVQSPFLQCEETEDGYLWTMK